MPMTRLTRLALPIFITSCTLGLFSCDKNSVPEGSPPQAKKVDTHESLAAEATELARHFADTIASAKDKASATSAVMKFDGIVTRFEELAGRMEAIGEPQGELREKVVRMFSEHEKIIAEKMEIVIKTLLSKREIGEILQQAMETVKQRMDKLTVLERWKGGIPEAVPSAASAPKPEVLPVAPPPDSRGSNPAAPPAE